ncbi:MAG: hypothetical protein IKT38_00455 [Clostridia bacterium]|nr:hypothetical protein [Clostridia bacterium]
MKKRVLALIIAVFLIFGCCGCNDTTVATETESWVEGGETTTDKSGSGTGNSGSGTGNSGSGGSNTTITEPMKVDLKGATITIYSATELFKLSDSSKTQKSKNDILNSVQKSLNCKFVIKEVDHEKLKTLTLSSAASGKALCNIISTNMQYVGTYVAAGVLTDFTRVSSMDLSQKYMNRLNMLEATELGGAKYAVTSENGSRTWGTFYNKRILKELGYSENYLYDLVDSKKWNYSAAREIGKKAMKDLDGKSGMSKDDQWGFLWVDPSMMTSHAIANSGGALIKHSKDKYLEYNMTDSRVISSINLINEFYKEGTTCRSISNYADRISAFAAGHSLFLFSNLYYAGTISGKMSDDFGVLPIPMVDGRSDYASALDWNAEVMMMPAGQSGKDQYNTGAVIQAIMSQCDKNVEVMKSEYNNRYFCDKQSGKNMVLAIEQDKGMVEAVYSSTNDDVLAGTYRPFWDLHDGKISSVVTQIDATKSTTIKAIQEINANAKKNKS